MVKHCPRCQTVKPLSDFTPDRSKASGYMSHCKSCNNAARRQRYYDRLEHEKQRQRVRYQQHREQTLARSRAWREANPDRVRELWQRHRRTPEQERVAYMARHGGIEEWNRMFADQGGLCYLCQKPLPTDRPETIHVDHDHTCCPGGKHDTRSCKACRRGLAHAACNQIIGLVGEDMDLLRTIAAQFEPAQQAARQRIAGMAKQDTLC